MDYPINIYDIHDDSNENLQFMTSQLDKPPKPDVKGERKKKKKSESEENIIVNDYGFIEED